MLPVETVVGEQPPPRVLAGWAWGAGTVGHGPSTPSPPSPGTVELEGACLLPLTG